MTSIASRCARRARPLPTCVNACHYSANPATPPPPNYAFAFAFDIDGVLLHGKTPISSAPETLSYLNSRSIPFILLTNGGGLSEQTRVQNLSKYLSTPISTSQFIQSHTPFRTHASPDATVLVVGGTRDNCRHVAASYGWNPDNIIIPGDLVAGTPSMSPFSDSERYEGFTRPVSQGRKIDAIFVFNDPRDWALDLQIIVDVLLSENGVIGTKVDPTRITSHVPVFFSNPDLWWANEYHLPRLGQGGFRAALEGVWRKVTGSASPLDAVTIGKPHGPTYKFAEDLLLKWRKERLGHEADLKTVYMVGDNPASDIAGANGYKSGRGVEWVSCLVKTGVWKSGEHDEGAKMVVKDVAEAVKRAVEREEGVRKN